MQRLQVHSWLATPKFSLEQVEDEIRVSNIMTPVPGACLARASSELSCTF